VESSTELRGAFTKIVQMLSMRDDLLPTEALDILSAARASVPPMPYRMIREQVRAELGKPPERLFARFEREAFAAASLGQVHRAELGSGESVVVKVQYPGVEHTVEQDLQNLHALLQVLTRIGRDVMRQRVDTASLHRELEERLSEELDYCKEAANITLFRELFGDDDEIQIPEVFAELSSRRVLTMSLLDGYPSPTCSVRVSTRSSRTGWRSNTSRRVPADPAFRRAAHRSAAGELSGHPSSQARRARLRIDPVFPEELRLSYLRLARALLDGDRREMAAACRALDYLGNGDSPEAMITILENLLEPLLEDREYDFRGYRSLDKAMQVAALAIEKGLYRTPGHRVFSSARSSASKPT